MMKSIDKDKGLKVFDIRWATDTAGPSPDNNMRTELFLLGCKKAKDGNPCKGCFNSKTWDADIAEFAWDPLDVAERINELAPNKYVTIGGGEPTDQIDQLIPLCKKLKEYGFHIMMYTWRDLSTLVDSKLISYYGVNKDYLNVVTHINELLKYIDIIVDGEFKQDERLYQEELGDGMLSSIGSGNQIVWDIKEKRDTESAVLLGHCMKDLVGLYVKPDTNDLVYITKN